MNAESPFNDDQVEIDLFHRLECWMQIAKDCNKEFVYDKSTGKWHWVDRDEIGNVAAYQGSFDTFFDALKDAVEPYVE